MSVMRPQRGAGLLHVPIRSPSSGAWSECLVLSQQASVPLSHLPSRMQWEYPRSGHFLNKPLPSLSPFLKLQNGGVFTWCL